VILFSVDVHGRFVNAQYIITVQPKQDTRLNKYCLGATGIFLRIDGVILTASVKAFFRTIPCLL
jgi:hypothetical protein